MPKEYRLVSTDSGYSYTVPEGEVFIGRGSEMKELLGKNLLVAIRQATLTIKEGKLFIRNMGANPSYINGMEICIQNGWIELHDGDELILVNVSLHVRISRLGGKS